MTVEFNEILLYADANGKVKIDVIYEEETFWLSQKKMAELFDVDRSVISKHLKNIFTSNELDEKSTVQFLHIANSDKPVAFYNLDAIIAVGYRVNSQRATQFRIWATQTLKEFIIKGFVLDDERLKQGKRFGKDYFDELLERIREIRASERRFYQKITDIYKECSIDYSEDDELTKKFYKTVQNKLEWAITGKTAAEIICDRADAEQPNMGLQTWRKAPSGKILKSDVSVAKNYLIEPEIKELERIVSMYLDYAENHAARHIPMKMADWIQKLDAFLKFNEYDILQDAGKVRHSVAVALAVKEYEKFRVIQDRNFESDFDKNVKKIVN
ncbi:MAG: virulence RhuM family protein [Methylococcaceae bacterium]